jgi:hypothetical protein
MARRREKQGETSRCCSRCCSRSARSCSNCNKASAIARYSVAGSVAELHSRHSAASQLAASNANKTCSGYAVQCMAVQCSVRRVGHHGIVRRVSVVARAWDPRAKAKRNQCSAGSVVKHGWHMYTPKGVSACFRFVRCSWAFGIFMCDAVCTNVRVCTLESHKHVLEKPAEGGVHGWGGVGWGEAWQGGAWGP